MEKRIVSEIDKSLVNLRKMETIQRKRLKELRGKDSMVLCGKKASNGTTYYCARKAGDKKFKYAGSSSAKLVKEIKEARYLKESLSRIDRNIQVLCDARANLKSTEYESVNMSLPKTYKGSNIASAPAGTEKARLWKQRMEAEKAKHATYRPEELKITTDDGNTVRSKSEALIYNHLLALGVTFVYEMPIWIDGHIYLSDFVLLSEADYETGIIIEHQGLMGDENYRRRFSEKVYGYLKAGYIPGINIFYTFDDMYGGLDGSPIDDIVRTRIRPAQYPA